MRKFGLFLVSLLSTLVIITVMLFVSVQFPMIIIFFALGVLISAVTHTIYELLDVRDYTRKTEKRRKERE